MNAYKKIGAIIILGISVMLFGCDTDKKKSVAGKPGLENGISLDNRFEQTDSIVTVFYKDPYGVDSLRYTRYYTQMTSTVKSDIDILLEELNSSFQQEAKRAKCRHEGKIWCYAGGRVFQTLYFNTSCDHCCHMLLIKNGNFYYANISNAFSNWLAGKKLTAKEPGNLSATE